ncbi:hypothetical protein T08_8653 [Trichinella sp. T8]|nr:hypothetical protein T08_8653 [Trichinella sp. T8]
MTRCTLPQQKIFTGHCCPECVWDLQVPTMFRHGKWPDVVGTADAAEASSS